MREARNFERCLENVTAGVRSCPGVYVGKIGGPSTPTQYVQGMQFGSRHFVALSAGLSSTHHFLQIWDVTDPHHPAQVVSGFNGHGIASFTARVALWQQSGAAYLGVRTESTVQIFDVTSCLTDGCGALPAPTGSLAVAPVSESNFWKSLTFSRSGATPFLFAGHHDLCHSGEGFEHTEHVLDVSDPAHPTDVSPTWPARAVRPWWARR